MEGNMPNIRIKVQDTADVFYNYADGTKRLFACMNTASIAKTVDTEDIRCGIGWNLASILYSNPDMTITMTPAFWNDYFLEDASGNTFAEGESVNVASYESVPFTDSAGDAVATITGTPVGDAVQVQGANGKNYVATHSAGTVTVASGAGASDLIGTTAIVIYDVASTGDVLDFESDVYPKVHGITIKTIAYDVDTNDILADIYFVFNRVLGDGAFDLALTGATNSVTEITARVLPEKTGTKNLFGQYIVVDRP